MRTIKYKFLVFLTGLWLLRTVSFWSLPCPSWTDMVLRTVFRPPLKKSLFPVQRVAEIMASRAAAKSFFFLGFFFWGGGGGGGGEKDEIF